MTRRSKAPMIAGLALVIPALTGCATLTQTPVTVAAEAADTAAVPAAPVEQLTVEIPKPRTGAPALKNTGTAWPGVLSSLAGYGQWILANPDPTRVADVAVPGCPAATTLTRQVTGLLGSTAYLEPSPPTFVTVTGPEAETATDTEATESAETATPAALGNKVTLHVTASRPSEPVINRAGRQISAFAPLPQTRLQITLHRGTDDKWRFCTVTAADAASPVSLL